MLKFETITETDRTCDTCHSAASTAYLCNSCDIHIHSANPIARRHHRISYGPDEEEANKNVTSFCGDVDEYLDLNDYQNYTLSQTVSFNNEVSISSMDVPESIVQKDLFSSPGVELEREARVLRYREKKKMRKFKKTIRYASRKAYAETRPRIKGRFAKRTELQGQVDQIFAAEDAYGVVPTF